MATRTLQKYLFLNFYLSLASEASVSAERLGGLMHQLRDPLITHKGSGLHITFWEQGAYSLKDQLPGQNPEKCAYYNRRCFEIIIAWCAVFREAAERDTTYKVHRPSKFGDDELTELILLTLWRGISDIFHFSGLISDPAQFLSQGVIATASPDNDSSPTPNAQNAGQHSTSHTETHIEQLSPFVQLPPGILQHICSYLAPHALFLLMSLCRKLRNLCTPLLYAAPLKACLDRDPPEIQYGNYNVVRLMVLFDERPDLHARLRRTHVMLPELYAERPRDAVDLYPKRHSDWRGVRLKEMTLLPPLPFALSNAIDNLTELKLGIPEDCEQCQTLVSAGIPSFCSRQPVLNALTKVAKRWPNLRALYLLTYYRGTTHHIQSQDTSDMTTLLGGLCNLETFKLHTYSAAGLLDIARYIVTASAATLRRLSLTSEASICSMKETLSFPICPNVVDLYISSDMMGDVAQVLLVRCFPSTISLCIQYFRTNPDNEYIPEINLSGCKTLQHLRVNGYSVMAFPTSLTTVSLGKDWTPWTDDPSRLPVAASVEAPFRMHADTIAVHMSILGGMFTRLKSLEIQTQYKNHLEVTLEELVSTLV